jgi:hypothetical protein
VISVTPITSKTKGTITTLTLQATDNIAVSAVKINYRPIGSSTFTPADLTKGTGNNFSVTLQESWFDAMGMEYFITATDNTPNTSRSPVSGSYYAYLTDPEVNVPIKSFGSQVTNYRIISFPYTTGNNAVTSLFDELGTYSNTKWRMARYNNPTDVFQEYPDVFTSVERGRGYWFIVKNTTEIKVGPVDAPKDNRASLYQMTLNPGWNLIGNPYPMDINWSDVLALNNNPAIGQLQVYTGGWSNATTLEAFQGGFVNLSGAANVMIKVPFKGQTTEGGRIKFHELTSDISKQEWKVDLHIFQSDTYNKIGGFGMSPVASDQKDENDAFNPPRFINSPEINFEKSSSDFLPAMDMVTTQNNFEWKFYSEGETGIVTTLKWNEELGNHNKELFLFDELNLKVVDMKSTSGYSFEQVSKKMPFNIFFGDNVREKISPEKILIASPYPNPVLKTEEVNIQLALPESSQTYYVEIEIIDEVGRVIRQQNASLDFGLHKIRIKGTDEAWTPGMNFYRVRISNGMINQSFYGKLIIR